VLVGQKNNDDNDINNMTMHPRMYVYFVRCFAMVTFLCCRHDNVSAVIVTAALTCHDHATATFMTTAMQSSVARALC